MKRCLYCRHEFSPNSNHQKVCFNDRCKKRLHADRINRYRRRRRLKEVESIIQNSRWPTIDEVISQSSLKKFRTASKMKELIVDQQIQQIRRGYSMLPTRSSSSSFLLGPYQFCISSMYDLDFHFKNYLQDEGIKLDRDEDGCFVVQYKKIDKGVQICSKAYACVWAQLLSYKLNDQFYNESSGVWDDANIFFLRSFDQLVSPMLSPKNPSYWYGPVFPQLLTIEHLINNILTWEKKSDNRFDIENVYEEKIASFLNILYEKISPGIEPSDPRFSLKERLLSYSWDKPVCEKIYFGLKKAVDFHGEPRLPIRKLK